MSLTPAIALRELVVLPGQLRVLVIGRASSVAAVEHHTTHGGPLALCVQRDPEVDQPLQAELASVACLAQALRMSRLPDGSLRLLVEGIERVGLTGAMVEVDGMTAVEVEALEDPEVETVGVRALDAQLTESFQEFLEASGIPKPDHDLLGDPAPPVGRLADQVAGTVTLTLAEQLAVLECSEAGERTGMVLDILAIKLAQQRIAADVNARVQAAMDQNQREYHLREQLKAIHAQLGDASPDGDAAKFEQRIEQSGMPDEVREEALREVARLRRIQTESAESTVIRTWLETVCDLPWSTATTDTHSLASASKVLNRDHYGLDNVKERLLEYLAVRQLRSDSPGPILCLVGPPGVGKTSLGRSIAEALGRKYTRVALGGIKDETEIRGHRRTYVGALPGRIIRGLIRAGSQNPVMVLDELDKVGNDFRGDPASALLEVLDPAQNNAFVDHYLDLPVDLSQVMFIATANWIDPIPAALRDRLEVIEIPGYAEEEKLEIAKKFLVPKLGREHGLDTKHIRFTKAAIQQTIRDYTREAGVRELERKLAAVHRKVARRVVEGNGERTQVTPNSLSKWLGPKTYHQELAERVDQPGVVIGLAWTATGGDILFVEATRMTGKPGLKLTGSLGDIMKESVEAAMSWLRSNALRYGVAATQFEAEFHLHVPAGGIPKDGPSAGVTMVTALASLVTGRCVRPSLAMTGEITLRGKVLPVGGIKEKALAARRAGVSTMILPSKNQADLEDIPVALKTGLDFIFVDSVHDVLVAALQPEAS